MVTMSMTCLCTTGAPAEHCVCAIDRNGKQRKRKKQEKHIVWVAITHRLCSGRRHASAEEYHIRKAVYYANKAVVEVRSGKRHE